MSEGVMIGNDVVDLRDPDSDSKTHPSRFDERVFSPDERRLLGETPDSSPLRWRLWAAKEAAFKAARKRDSRVFFSPPNFQVELCGQVSGRVTHRTREGLRERFDLRWWQSDDAVHAVASTQSEGQRPDDTGLIHGFRRLEADGADPEPDLARGPSRAVRDFALERVAAALGACRDEFEIRTHERVPALWRSGRPAAADLSLSHHGEWVAFACQIGCERS